MSSWKEFWGGEHRIYVSERHLAVYYDRLYRDVRALLPAARPLTLLDWGCGDAHAAPRFAQDGIRMLLYDAVPEVEARLRTRYGGLSGVRVLAGGELSQLEAGSVDAVLVHSVLQYLSKEEFRALLPRFRELLSSEGVILLGDVVPPDMSMFVDVYDLLSAGLRHGFFWHAVWGLATTVFSKYRKVRRESGFSTYAAEELVEVLKAAGFDAERMPKNLGLSAHRMLIRARKTP